MSNSNTPESVRRAIAQVIPLVALLCLPVGCASPTKETAPQPAVSHHESTPAQRAVSPATNDLIKTAAAKPSMPFEGEGWQPMFDGASLKGWRETAFAGRGEVECRAGLLVLNMGDPFTGINWTNDFPQVTYELAFEAMPSPPSVLF